LKNILNILTNDNLIISDLDSIKLVDAFASSESEHIVSIPMFNGRFKEIKQNLGETFNEGCEKIKSLCNAIFNDDTYEDNCKLIIRVIYLIFKPIIVRILNGMKAQFIEYTRCALTPKLISNAFNQFNQLNEGIGATIQQYIEYSSLYEERYKYPPTAADISWYTYLTSSQYQSLTGQLKRILFLDQMTLPASSTPASGTPASGTPESSTPASGTPASGIPASNKNLARIASMENL
jgi:hypothetical protein